MASTRGRSVVVPMTNKSGGGVVAGDVVIIDTSNDSAFTTTTSARSTTSIGIAQDTIANNGTGRVLVSGYAALVNVPASVTRGHYIETHTVAKQATGNSARRSGSFGQFLTGGTTPIGAIWGTTDTSAGTGTGQGLVDFAQILYTTADITCDADNIWEDLAGLGDITLTAASGDWIEVGASFMAPNTTAVALCFDVGTIVSAAVVNHISQGGSPDNAKLGVGAWRIPNAVQGAVGGSIMYQLVSGDITGGTVVLRMRDRPEGTTNRDISASTARPLHFWAKNLGPSL